MFRREALVHSLASFLARRRRLLLFFYLHEAQSIFERFSLLDAKVDGGSELLSLIHLDPSLVPGVLKSRTSASHHPTVTFSRLHSSVFQRRHSQPPTDRTRARAYDHLSRALTSSRANTHEPIIIWTTLHLHGAERAGEPRRVRARQHDLVLLRLRSLLLWLLLLWWRWRNVRHRRLLVVVVIPVVVVVVVAEHCFLFGAVGGGGWASPSGSGIPPAGLLGRSPSALGRQAHSLGSVLPLPHLVVVVVVVSWRLMWLALVCLSRRVLGERAAPPTGCASMVVGMWCVT